MTLNRPLSRGALPLVAPALILLALSGCAVVAPTGPSVVALPPPGKTLNAFQQEDYACRDYAFRTNGGDNASQQATNNGVSSAAVGTLGGAAVGALLGAAAGNPGAGAAAGAGAGLLFGSAAGANGAQASADNLQARFDAAYAQCMASKGNSISQPQQVVPAYAPPPAVYYAPPPRPYYYGPRGYWW